PRLLLLCAQRDALDAGVTVGGIVRVDVDDIVAGVLELDLARERILLAGIGERYGRGRLAAALDDGGDLNLVRVPNPAGLGRTAAHHRHFGLERDHLRAA